MNERAARGSPAARNARVDLKDLRRLLPRNARDVAAARALVAADAERLAPLVPELLRRLQDHDSPVAAVYCDFFANPGQRFGAEIGRALAGRSMPAVKHTIVTRILPRWPRDALVPLAGVLQMLVSHTDGFDTDLHCIRLLAEHRLCDAAWLRQWLDFKIDRQRARAAIARDIESALNR